MKEVNPVKTLDSIDKDKSSDKIIKKLTPKEKSYLLLTKALPPLEKIAKGWPARQDLQETIQLLKKTLEKNHLNGHTKAFVSILSTLEGIIPLTKQSKDYPLLVKLQRKVLSHNKETNNQVIIIHTRIRFITAPRPLLEEMMMMTRQLQQLDSWHSDFPQ